MSVAPARLATLADIEAALWQALGQAANDPPQRDQDWRTPVLATVDVDGGADARTVVLREADATARLLRFYTDARAAKVAQLRAQPLATLALWSARLGWQLRCRVRCQVEDDGLAVSSRWARVKLSPAAQDYLSPLPPGAALGSEAPALTHRGYFAVVSAAVEAIDWLELHPQGHRRARFTAGADAVWLQP